MPATAMYRCILNKAVDAPVAVRVEVTDDAVASSYRPARASGPNPEPHDDVPDAFVLFHADLRTAALERGLMANSTADDLWRVIARHVDVVDPDAEDDAAEAY